MESRSTGKTPLRRCSTENQRSENQRCQEPLFFPHSLKVKTNTAQQAVQADKDKRRVFGLRRFSASLIVCRSSRRLSVRLTLDVRLHGPSIFDNSICCNAYWFPREFLDARDRRAHVWRALGVGAGLGLAWGIAARIWMRLISTNFESRPQLRAVGFLRRLNDARDRLIGFIAGQRTVGEA